MELTYECPNCQAASRTAVDEGSESANCHRCGKLQRLRPDSLVGGELSGCVCCGTGDLYTQKDFPHVLGFAIVVAGFAVSSLFWYFLMPVPAYAILLATAALDLILFYMVPDVTICYRCLGQHRGEGVNPGNRFTPFDLAIGERYRQERIRVEELRARSETSAFSPPG